ncbi:MAG: Mor transcription activator family protein [Candidatus Contendobacter sp.]|nr:Mor transcription activator family protein [Candidatus Contendobacter sp.]
MGGSSRNISPGCHPTTAEVAEILHEELARRGIDRAASISREITEAMRRRFAGCALYWPLSLPNRLARDAKIFEEFNGCNQSMLAVQHGTTLKNIYAILKRESQRRAGPNSPPPPDGRRKPQPPEGW